MRKGFYNPETARLCGLDAQGFNYREISGLDNCQMKRADKTPLLSCFETQKRLSCEKLNAKGDNLFQEKHVRMQS